jgi:hypothetical protein
LFLLRFLLLLLLLLFFFIILFLLFLFSLKWQTSWKFWKRRIAPLMVTYHYVKFYVSIIIHVEVININVRNFNFPIGFYTKIQLCPISSKFDMWVDNDVPNDISKILKTQNCSSNGDLSLCQIVCLYHYQFRSYQHLKNGR